MNVATETYDNYYGRENVERAHPIVETPDGRVWYTVGGKQGEEPIIALFPDSWAEGENPMPHLERLPSGTEAAKIPGHERVVVP